MCSNFNFRRASTRRFASAQPQLARGHDWTLTLEWCERGETGLSRVSASPAAFEVSR